MFQVPEKTEGSDSTSDENAEGASSDPDLSQRLEAEKAAAAAAAAALKEAEKIAAATAAEQEAKKAKKKNKKKEEEEARQGTGMTKRQLPEGSTSKKKQKKVRYVKICQSAFFLFPKNWTVII